MKISLLPSFVAAVSDRRRPSSLSSLNVLAALIALAPLSALAQGNDNPTGVSGIFNGNSNTGCSYDPYTANATRTIPDIIVTGAVGSYPLQWSRIMNSRGGGGFLGAGGGWRHSYQWSCLISGDATGTPDNYTVYYPDGRKVIFGSRVGLAYKGPSGVTDRFTGAFATGDCYLLLADGGKVRFHQTGIPDQGGGYNFTMDPPDQITDPNGLSTLLDYDTSNKLIQVTEPAGRWLKIYYNTSGTYVGLISEVDAGYGTATYTQIVTYDYQHLLYGLFYWNVLWHANYSDAAGSTATYTYQAANDSSSGAPLIKTCSDLRYPGPMKNIAYTFVTGGFHGQFLNAKHFITDSTPVVSYNLGTHIETRGDGPTRTFTFGAYLGTTGVYKPYLLKTYTDFAGHTATLSYDANGYVSSIQDFNLHTTSFVRIATTGVITKITHPGDASHIDYVYEDPYTGYYLKTVTDELLNVTTYKHSNTTTMNTSEIDYPDGGVELFSYNGFNQVSSHTMVSNANGSTGGVETFTYDTGGRGLLTKYTPPTGTDGPTNYTYNINDHLSTITDPRTNKTTLFHDQVGRLTIIQYPGTPSTDVDVGYVYNLDGTVDYQLVRQTATTWAETDYTYDDYKRVKTIVRPMRDASDTARTTKFWYDANGTADDYTHTDSNPTFVTTPAGVDVANLYDNNFRLLSRTIGDNGSPDSTPATTSYTYEPVGNLSTMIDPKGDKWSYGYDPRNRLFAMNDPTLNDTDPATNDANSLGYTVTYTYDVANNKKSEQRANDQVITYDTYDAMNRLTKMTIPQGTTPAAVTSYTWTKAGKLDTMTDPGVGGAGRIYNYDYDTLNRLTTTTYPSDGGGVVRTEVRTYDPAGNLATFKNRAGNKQTFTYDTRNRELTYAWDDGVTPGRTLTYDYASHVLTCYNGNATITNTYFDDGLLSTSNIHNYNYGDYIGTVSYTYDADGRRATIEYPSGKKYTVGYTRRGELRTLYDVATPTHFEAYYIYDPAGNRVTRNLDQYQTHTTSAFDCLNRPTQIQHFLAAGSSPKFNYGYDEISRRLYEQRDGGTADGFGYDLNSQLTSFIRDGTLSGGTVSGTTTNTHTLAYDASGNRTTAVDNGATTTYGVNALNQYSSQTGLPTPTYDGNGNLKTYNGWTYTYDAMNRLTAAVKGSASANFWYDGLNRICTWQENGSGFARFNVYDGWDLVAEYQAGNVLDTEYLHGAGSDELVSMTRAGVTSYFFQDGRGNTTHGVDASGALVETYTYDAHGAATITVAPGKTATGNRFMFSGREYFAVSGLYNYRNRFYSPTWGRFLQPDPIGFAGDPANLYRYCGNNSVNASDPMGTNGGDRRSPNATGTNGDLKGRLPYGTGGLPAFGYDGNAGWGIYAFNQGNLGILQHGGLYDGMILGGPANRNGLSWHGLPVKDVFWARRATAVNGAPTGASSGASVPKGNVIIGPGPIYAINDEVPFYLRPVSAETAAWTDSGRVPTLIATGIVLGVWALPGSAAATWDIVISGGSSAWGVMQRWGPIFYVLRQLSRDSIEDSNYLPDEPVPFEQTEPATGRQFQPRNPAWATPGPGG
jgi:RHS repeat-associated protein